ncbi:hypothetical protein FRC12_004368 [Ceratobasidium sp. 428]|nr:hypothetical protein FRC12_004368 [Ceratobasidium sp. 428]
MCMSLTASRNATPSGQNASRISPDPRRLSRPSSLRNLGTGPFRSILDRRLDVNRIQANSRPSIVRPYVVNRVNLGRNNDRFIRNFRLTSELSTSKIDSICPTMGWMAVR